MRLPGCQIQKINKCKNKNLGECLVHHKIVQTKICRGCRLKKIYAEGLKQENIYIRNHRGSRTDQMTNISRLLPLFFRNKYK